MDEEERRRQRKDETFVLFSASHLLGDLQLLGDLSYTGPEINTCTFL